MSVSSLSSRFSLPSSPSPSSIMFLSLVAGRERTYNTLLRKNSPGLPSNLRRVANHVDRLWIARRRAEQL